jgi:hypothetical protein
LRAGVSAVGDRWWDSWVPALRPYAVLLRLFIDGAFSAGEFEVVFLRLVKDDPTDWPPDVYDVLDSFFADVDDYCADSDLRSKVGGLDDDGLRERAGQAFDRLRAIAGWGPLRRAVPWIGQMILLVAACVAIA